MIIREESFESWSESICERKEKEIDRWTIFRFSLFDAFPSAIDLISIMSRERRGPFSVS